MEYITYSFQILGYGHLWRGAGGGIILPTTVMYSKCQIYSIFETISPNHKPQTIQVLKVSGDLHLTFLVI